MFVTQEDDEIEEFEKDKEQEVEGVVGSKVEKKTVLQGWGSWAGDGVDNSHYERKQKKMDEIRRRKIDELKSKRQDAKMKGV